MIEGSGGMRAISVPLLAAFWLATAVAASPVLSASLEVTYNYDDVGRLKSAAYPSLGVTIQYSYDDVGNRTARVISGIGLTAAPDLVATSAGVSVTVDVLANDHSDDPAPLQVVAVGQPVHGTSQITAGGASVSYTPPAAYAGTDVFDYELEDGLGRRGRAVVSVTVTDLLTLAVNDAAEVAEGGNLSYPVTMSAPALGGEVIDWSITGGDWEAGDLTQTSGDVTLTAGQSTLSIPVGTVQDAVFELTEQVEITISTSDPSVQISTASANGLIGNDDAAPEFSIAALQGTEGGIVTFMVSRTGTTELVHDVSYATSDGTATAPADYTAQSGTLTFQPSDSQLDVQVPAVLDSTFEGVETVRVTLSAPTAGAQIKSGEGTYLADIVDASAFPEFFVVAGAWANEGDPLEVFVQCDGETTVIQTIDYAVSAGTAETGDFTPIAAGTLSFDPNGPVVAQRNLQSLTIPTVEDTVFEDAETIVVTLSNPQGGATIRAGGGTGTGEIRNDDTAPNFDVSNVSVAEGGTLSFTVTRQGPTELAHNVDYATSDGTAVAGADYTTASGTLSFAAGTADATDTVAVTTLQDTVFEGDETVLVTLSVPTGGATIGTSPGTGTITNDGDAAPSFVISNASVAEGGTLSFTVTRQGATELEHSVSYATANGTATAGSDYTAKSGSLSFAASTTNSSQTVTIATLENSVFESDETMVVNLSSPTNSAQIADGQGTGTITNDDPGPQFAVNDVSVSEGGTATFTVTRTGSTDLSHNVGYTTSNGTATAGSDYTATNGTLTFGPTQSSRTVAVSTINDATIELAETFHLDLTSATNGTISDSRGVATIAASDNAPPVANNDGQVRLQIWEMETIFPLVNDTDPNGHSLTIISATNPAKGSASIINGGTAIRFSAGGSSGFSNFQYTISDGYGGTDTATISVYVEPFSDGDCGAHPC